MPQPYLKVIGVMGGGDFNHTGAKIHFYIAVCHNGNLTAHQRQDYRFTNQRLIPLVIRVNRQRRIAQQRLWAGGGDFQIAATIRQGITNVPEMAVVFFIFYLRIRDRGQAMGAPVDDALAAIN